MSFEQHNTCCNKDNYSAPPTPVLINTGNPTWGDIDMIKVLRIQLKKTPVFLQHLEGKSRIIAREAKAYLVSRRCDSKGSVVPEKWVLWKLQRNFILWMNIRKSLKNWSSYREQGTPSKWTMYCRNNELRFNNGLQSHHDRTCQICFKATGIITLVQTSCALKKKKKKCFVNIPSVFYSNQCKSLTNRILLNICINF